MKTLRTLLVCAAMVGGLLGAAYAQSTGLVTPAASPRAWVGLQVGLTDIQIRYSSPSLNGRDVFADPNLVDRGETPRPWRGGADEATVLTVSTDVQIGDKALPAGSYSLFFVVNPDKWTLIVNREASQWGAYFYDAKADVLRLDLTPTEGPKTENLTYTLSRSSAHTATAQLAWDGKRVSFPIRVDLGQTVTAKLREQLKGREAFNWVAWNAAAQWCLQNNVNLEEALKWTDTAIQPPFGPNEPRVAILTTKSALLAKLGRTEEANKIDQQALTLSTAQELLDRTANSYRGGDKARAQATIDYALKKYPNAWETANAQGFWYRMEGDLAKAITYYQKAHDLCPGAQTKSQFAARVKGLQEQLKAKK